MSFRYKNHRIAAKHSFPKNGFLTAKLDNDLCNNIRIVKLENIFGIHFVKLSSIIFYETTFVKLNSTTFYKTTFVELNSTTFYETTFGKLNSTIYYETSLLKLNTAVFYNTTFVE